MPPLTLQKLVKEISKRKKTYVWIRTDANASDIDAIRQAGEPSIFDPLHLRANLISSNPDITARELREKGTWKVVAKVVVICEKGRKEQKISFPFISLKLRTFLLCKGHIDMDHILYIVTLKFGGEKF